MKDDILVVAKSWNGFKRRIISEIKIEFIDSKLNFDCMAVWDTGATNSYVLPKLFENFNLVKFKETEIKNRKDRKFRQYRTNLYLSNTGVGICFKNFKITEYDFKWDEEIIIGMDIIKLGKFFITNYKNKTHFSFLISRETVDQINNGNIPCCSFGIEIDK